MEKVKEGAWNEKPGEELKSEQHASLQTPIEKFSSTALALGRRSSVFTRPLARATYGPMQSRCTKAGRSQVRYVAIGVDVEGGDIDDRSLEQDAVGLPDRFRGGIGGREPVPTREAVVHQELKDSDLASLGSDAHIEQFLPCTRRREQVQEKRQMPSRGTSCTRYYQTALET
jgi:hypothetical protein